MGPILLSHCPSSPMCPRVEGYNPTILPIPGPLGHPGQVPCIPCVPEWRATIPLSFPSQSPGTHWDIPDRSHVSHVSQSGGLQSHCPSHPRVPGHTGTSRTGPVCPRVEGYNPTVLPIPEFRDTLGNPGQVPCIPEWRATIPLSFPSQSPGTHWDIPDRSHVSHSGGLQSHCPSRP